MTLLVRDVKALECRGGELDWKEYEVGILSCSPWSLYLVTKDGLELI